MAHYASSRPAVHGFAAPGFEGVRAAFAHNLASGAELGSACALQRDGETLVDLWGGVRDPAAPHAAWERETVVLVYSVTKGFAAAAFAWLHANGRFDYDAPVATYWPAFAQNGKADITVRTLFAHQAGLSGIATPLTPALIGDLDALAAILAAQRPVWTPGSEHAYHAMSLGFYQNELARRIDEHGRTLGAIVLDEFARPLGERLSIGAPQDLPASRIASIEPIAPHRMFAHPRQISPRFALALICPPSLTAKSVRNPKLRGPTELDDAQWRRLEVPSSNGYASARAVAALYAALAGDGAALGIDDGSLALLREPTVLPPSGERDRVFKRRTAYALGFMKPSTDFAFGSSPAAFGAPGVGGSFGYADPATRTGYAYVTNRLGFSVFDDPREKRLRRACEQALAQS